jgi:hypothetical protein
LSNATAAAARRSSYENLREGTAMADVPKNPKLDPHPGSAEKPPEERVSGDEPMTGAQASYLTTLGEEAKVDPPTGALSKAEASRLTDELKARLGR